MDKIFQDKGYIMNGLNSILVNAQYQIYSIQAQRREKMKKITLLDKLRILYQLEFAKYDTKRFCKSLDKYTSDTLLDLFLFIHTAKVGLIYDKDKFINYRVKDRSILTVDTENKQLICSYNFNIDSDIVSTTHYIKYYTDRIRVVYESEENVSITNKKHLITRTYDINELINNGKNWYDGSIKDADYLTTELLVQTYITNALSIITMDVYKNLKKTLFSKKKNYNKKENKK